MLRVEQMSLYIHKLRICCFHKDVRARDEPYFLALYLCLFPPRNLENNTCQNTEKYMQA